MFRKIINVNVDDKLPTDFGFSVSSKVYIFRLLFFMGWLLGVVALLLFFFLIYWTMSYVQVDKQLLDLLVVFMIICVVFMVFRYLFRKRQIEFAPSIEIVPSRVDSFGCYGLGLIGILAKRIFDLSMAFVLLILLSPLLLIISLAIRIDSPGPSVYRRMGVGKYGIPFGVFRFRTMYIDAEARIKSVVQSSSEPDKLIVIKNDPRVTRIGRLLRRTSLDELPQLVNIIKGEMSFVGPGPMSLTDARQLVPQYHRRFMVAPGLTGLAQLQGRESLELDSWYVENHNLWLDLKLLFATILAVMFGISSTKIHMDMPIYARNGELLSGPLEYHNELGL